MQDEMAGFDWPGCSPALLAIIKKTTLRLEHVGDLGAIRPSLPMPLLLLIFVLVILRRRRLGVKKEKWRQSVMSFNLVRPPFCSMADAVKVRLLSALSWGF